MKRILFLVFTLLFSFSCSDPITTTSARVEITFPKEGDLVKNANLRVKGRASNTDSVLVNGEVADVVGDIWEISLRFSQGNQSVKATSGSASDEVHFLIDSVGPELVVNEPVRGAYFTKGSDPESVMVKGKVEEGNIDIFTINEQIIELQADGSFEYAFLLKEGLNEINVAAIDKAGNKTEDIRAVMYGTWIDPSADIDPGMNLFVRQALMKKTEVIFKEVATPELVKTFVSTSFPDTFVLNTISFDPLDVSIDLKKDAIATDFLITNLKIDGVFTIAGSDITTIIEIDSIRSKQDIVPLVTADGGFELSFKNSVLELEPEDVRFNIGGLSSEDADSLRSFAVDIVKAAFGDFLAEAVFNELIDPDILIRKTELLGRELIFQLKLQEISIFSDGILARTAFILPSEGAEEVRDVPGALNRQSGLAGGGEPAGDILFTTSRNAFDRIAHGIWNSGLFHLTLEKNQFAGLTLPFDLTASGLALALDSRISNIAGPDAPVILRLRPQLPPVVELDKNTNKIQVKMGEFLVDFIVLDGTKEIVVATMAAFFDLGINVNVNGFLIELAFDTSLRADLIREPEIDLDDQKTEKLFEDLIALIPKIFENNLNLRGKADIFWITLQNPDILIHGEDQDYVSFGMEVEPNLDALPGAP